MSDYLEIKITSGDFDDQPTHRLQVRSDLPVRSLIHEITSEFQLKGDYTIWFKDNRQELDHNRTVSESAVRTGSELEFGLRKRRIPSGATEIATDRRMVIDFEYGDERRRYEINWQPAFIGRQEPDSPAAANLAVNLFDFDTNRNVSREHANITENDGRYMVQGIKDNNPTFLNDRELQPHVPRTLHDGDVIRVGPFELRVSFVTSDGAPAGDIEDEGTPTGMPDTDTMEFKRPDFNTDGDDTQVKSQ